MPRLTIDDRADGTVVLTGELDLGQCDTLRAALTDGPVRVLDLTNLRFLDSAGVSVLFEQAARPVRFRVRRDSAVAKVITIVGLEDLAEVEFVVR